MCVIPHSARCSLLGHECLAVVLPLPDRALYSAQNLSNRTQTVPKEHFCASAHLRFPETSQIVIVQSCLISNYFNFLQMKQDNFKFSLEKTLFSEKCKFPSYGKIGRLGKNGLYECDYSYLVRY